MGIRQHRPERSGPAEKWPTRVTTDRAPARDEPLQEHLAGVEFARVRLGFEPDEVQAGLLAAEHHRLILNCTRQWGKSTVTAAKAVHRACSRAGSLTIVVSPSERQSAEFVRKAAEFVRRTGVKPRGDGDNAVSLMLPNGSRIVGLPGTESTTRGYSAVSLLIVDEASRVADEQYMALKPMLATVDGDLWLVSTPWVKRGFFWEVWTGGGAEWERVKVAATECSRIPAHFLEAQRREMGELWFRREFLCEFEDGEGTLFDRELLMAAINPKIRPLFEG